jgi:uncharacterized protein with FMN-binding domain
MSELMRRAAPGLALAGAALATVWVFDPALHAAVATTAAPSTTDSDTSSETPADSGTSTDSGDTGTSAEEPAPTAEEPAAADCSNIESVTGDDAMTPWGPVQVRMDFAADGTVCGVQALTYPVGDQKSQMINSMAIPTLDAQAAEQGVEFDGVSGATYTTEAYRESMQSILDQR